MVVFTFVFPFSHVRQPDNVDHRNLMFTKCMNAATQDENNSVK
jgi:hypothetical protein